MQNIDRRGLSKTRLFRPNPAAKTRSPPVAGRAWRARYRWPELASWAGYPTPSLKGRSGHILEESWYQRGLRPLVFSPQSLDETFEKVFCSPVPTAVIATIAATAMSEAIRPYSMAVAPESSFTNLRKTFFIRLSPETCRVNTEKFCTRGLSRKLIRLREYCMFRLTKLRWFPKF